MDRPPNARLVVHEVLHVRVTHEEVEAAAPVRLQRLALWVSSHRQHHRLYPPHLGHSPLPSYASDSEEEDNPAPEPLHRPRREVPPHRCQRLLHPPCADDTLPVVVLGCIATIPPPRGRLRAVRLVPRRLVQVFELEGDALEGVGAGEVVPSGLVEGEVAEGLCRLLLDLDCLLVKGHGLDQGLDAPLRHDGRAVLLEAREDAEEGEGDGDLVHAAALGALLADAAHQRLDGLGAHVIHGLFVGWREDKIIVHSHVGLYEEVVGEGGGAADAGGEGVGLLLGGHRGQHAVLLLPHALVCPRLGRLLHGRRRPIVRRPRPTIHRYPRCLCWRASSPDFVPRALEPHFPQLTRSW
mmetsp:Transcript_52037/g.127016  ORF Transcript_52037/g.127016 Transcript_52037/m.127016 type:complete len:353 (+) Transcript_52037:687-1745(+)